MNIQPRVISVDMDMKRCNAFGVISHVRISVELWKEVGLCIHTYINHTTEEYENGYRISHYQSGRMILKRLKNRKHAIEYMMKSRVVRSDWKQTYEQFITLAGTTPIVEQMIALQEYIDTDIGRKGHV